MITEPTEAIVPRASWWRRRPSRIAKSLLAWLIANPLGWAGASVVFLVGSNIHQNMAEHAVRGMMDDVSGGSALLFAAFGCMFSYPPTLIVGLPVLHLLRRREIVGLWSNVLAAVVIGYPVGVTVLMVKNGAIAPPNETAVSGLLNSAALSMPFLIVGSILFWLIRRPDRDPPAAPSA